MAKRASSHTKKRAKRTGPEAVSAPTGAPEGGAQNGNRCPVAGFGASAGGLEAFTEVLQHLPEDAGMAFVLVQHLDPKHASLLTELLAKATRMQVMQVSEGLQVAANKVYVIPPNACMTISKGILHLEPRQPHYMPIDHFFRSLAVDQGSKAIGVILSGTASDGTLGLKAIKAEGGITFAQDEKTARYDGMPRSAILAGCVDFVLTPEGIARELVRLCRHPYVAPADGATPVPDENEEQFNQIFTMLRNSTGVDFRYYKHGTIRRRILRRMALHRMEKIQQYTDFLHHSPGELEALFQDILIHVTSFFREPTTFDALKEKILPALFKDRSSEDPVRIWVPGCATGEEAYSVAICVHEYIRENNLDFGVQIFGTDLSDSNLETARAGIYAESIAADISGERLRRFFVKLTGGYQISRFIRDMCVFARQNLIKDPPFSRLDLITCRNVLIYLGPVLQAKVLRYFHYGLKPTGYLVLGASENISSFTDFFAAIGGKERIYKKKTAPAAVNLDLGAFEEVRHGIEVKRAEERVSAPELHRRVDQMILARYSPPGVVVDEDLKILQFRGHTAPYLEHTTGQPSLNLLEMTRGGMAVLLRRLIQRVKKTTSSTVSEEVQLSPRDGVRPVRLAVSPIKAQGNGESAYLIVFEPVERVEKAPNGQKQADLGARTRSTSRIRELEEELGTTKQYLQTVIEEQEAASEELKSAHEEVQSSNEELQSTNEELLTSKEELQSTNEELNTLNEEMQSRNAELTQINNDLTNLLSSVNIPIVMLGNDLRIRRFTPNAEKVLNLLPTDVGRKISDFRIKINIPDVEQLFTDVLENLQTKEREVQDREGRTYLMTVRPYRTIENRIDGAVMSLYEITERKQAAEIRYRRLFEAAKDGVLIVESKTGEILDSNPFISNLFGYSRAELMGRPFWATPLFENTELTASDVAELREGGSLQKTLTLSGKSGEQTTIELVANAYTEGQKEVVQMNLRDVSARVRAEESLRQSEEERRTAEKMEAVGRLAGGVAHDFNNLLTAVVGYADLLKERLGDNEEARRVLDEISRAGERATNLIRQLLAFGRKQILQPKLLDINRVITDLQQMLRIVVSEKVELVLQPDPALGRVMADQGQVEQVLTNLVLNARDAMPQGGRITIATANAQVDEAWSREHSSVPPGDYVMLSVTDTGTGMDSETRAHLFEPFFTTKAKGRGTGLGLSTIYTIVTQSGGHIWAFSELGRGTTFQIYLPRVAADGEAAAPQPQAAAAPRGTETILLVEDDPMVRRLTQTILQERGYKVLAAANGSEALRLSRDAKQPIHLLLSDVVMPQMSGREVADRLAAQRQGLKILFMSGHAEDAIVDHGVLEPGFAFLQKPFTPDGLAVKVREVLDAARKA